MTTYDATSSIKSLGVGTRAQWVAELDRRGADAPVQIVDAYVKYGALIGYNHDLALAQGVVESAGFSDWKWIERRNPCGLGSTSRETPGAAFPSIEAGITAQYAHQAAYAESAASCPIEKLGAEYADLYNDPRHLFHKGTPAISAWNGAWAVPGKKYAENVCAVANAVVGDAQPAPQPPAPQPGGKQLDIKQDLTPVNHTSGRSGQSIQALVLHVMAGTYQGSINWFKNASAAASAHYCVSEQGEVTQCVDDGDMAWANGIVQRSSLPDWLQALVNQGVNPNNVTLSIETAEQPFEDGYPFPDEYAAVVALMRQKADEHGITIDRDHILGHYQFDGINRPNCPGAHWNWDQLVADVAAGGATPIAPAPGRIDPAVDGLFFHETGHWVMNGFWHYWRDKGGIEMFGLPLSDEIADPSGAQLARGGAMTVQYFERACFEYHPENDEGQRVWLKRIGADAAKAAGLTGPGIG